MGGEGWRQVRGGGDMEGTRGCSMAFQIQRRPRSAAGDLEEALGVLEGASQGWWERAPLERAEAAQAMDLEGALSAWAGAFGARIGVDDASDRQATSIRMMWTRKSCIFGFRVVEIEKKKIRPPEIKKKERNMLLAFFYFVFFLFFSGSSDFTIRFARQKCTELQPHALRRKNVVKFIEKH